MSEVDNFKHKFKYFKSKRPPPSLENVVMFNNNNSEVNLGTTKSNDDSRCTALGLTDFKTWSVYKFVKHRGLYLVKNPFTSLGQRYWIRRCLERYSCKPSKRNIDIDVCPSDWWSSCYINERCDRDLQKKLRWATLGYHHNWDTKIYSEDKKTEFPKELAELSDIVARALGYEAFRAEAAIVNYYHSDSTLSPHTDHSEVNLKAPLFSFSFGQPAIFLIGGEDKTVDPSAILLSSGDIAVMSQRARLCYHAVPRILKTDQKPWNDCIEEISLSGDFKFIDNSDDVLLDMNRNVDNDGWSRFADYVEESRINVNVRQVLLEHQDALVSS